MKAKAPSPERSAVLLICALGVLGACADDARTSPVFVLSDAPQERVCRIDADCTAVFLPCRGWQPVHRDRADALSIRYEEENLEEMRRSECPGDLQPPVVGCLAAVCTLTPTADAPGRAP
jgi:hypothetical protein